MIHLQIVLALARCLAQSQLRCPQFRPCIKSSKTETLQLDDRRYGVRKHETNDSVCFVLGSSTSRIHAPATHRTAVQTAHNARALGCGIVAVRTPELHVEVAQHGTLGKAQDNGNDHGPRRSQPPDQLEKRNHWLGSTGSPASHVQDMGTILQKTEESLGYIQNFRIILDCPASFKIFAPP